MTARGRKPSARAVATARSRLSGARLKLVSSTSANTGVAPSSATTSAVAMKVKSGQITASPGPIAFAISTSSSASVPLAQPMAWRAPQKAASSASNSRTSGPWMNWQWASTRAIASSMARPSRRRCAATSMNGIGAGWRRCGRFIAVRSCTETGSAGQPPRTRAAARRARQGAAFEAADRDLEARHALLAGHRGLAWSRIALANACSSARSGSA